MLNPASHFRCTVRSASSYMSVTVGCNRHINIISLSWAPFKGWGAICMLTFRLDKITTKLDEFYPSGCQKNGLTFYDEK